MRVGSIRFIVAEPNWRSFDLSRLNGANKTNPHYQETTNDISQFVRKNIIIIDAFGKCSGEREGFPHP
jgi:hypothetical protein